ncbi:MAG: biotin/lipoyl-binding protein [Pedobacter sp.]|nr:MAG: biotin/lipoyl-binding protein [Pedobacter sp.]
MKINKYHLSFIIPLLLSSCAGKDNKLGSLKQENAKVSILKISAKSNLAKFNYSGSIEPDNTVKIGFAIPGIINKVYVDEGQFVEKGQLLATIDDTEYRNSLLIADAALSQTEDLYGRLKDLFEKESLPEKDFIDIKTKLAQAKASKNINTKRINDCRLYVYFGESDPSVSGQTGHQIDYRMMHI